MRKLVATPPLQLVPLDVELAAPPLAGDFSLAWKRAEGWPHEDTLDAYPDGGRSRGPRSLVWLVTLEGVVIGDCGTVGFLLASRWRGSRSAMEYSAAEHRGRGYGSKVVEALSKAGCATRPGVRRVVAETLAVNAPSRRALERAGFMLEYEEPDRVWYALPGR